MQGRTTFDVVFYHAPCADGFTCRFIVEMQNPNACFIGLDTRSPFPKEHLQTVTGKRVIMMDIAFDTDTMLSIDERAAHFVVIDHHETNMKHLGELSFAHFDMRKAGCHLVWQYFNPGKEMPAFIDYIGLRDIWKHKDNQHALYFTSGFVCPDYDFGLFSKYYYNSNGEVISTMEKGKILYDFQQQTVREICKSAVKHPTKNMIIVNTHYPFISDVGDCLRTQNPQYIILMWSKKYSDSAYRYALRSADSGPNVATFAEAFGGGGHAHAAGFGSTKSPDELFK